MTDKIEKAIGYIGETLGVQPLVTPVAKNSLDVLPIYIHETYRLYKTVLFNSEIILVELKNEDKLSIHQTEKQVLQIRNRLNQKVAVVLENVQAYNRKRLIEKGVNFIVPGKQLYLPELLIDLREIYTHPKSKLRDRELLPSAQLLLIYHIIHPNQDWKLEEQPFKEIARKLAYTPMAITNAINNLKFHGLAEVKGVKEKYIRFLYSRHELWKVAFEQDLLVNPVIKTVFVDQQPKGIYLLQSNTSALSEYSSLSPGIQKYYAIDKTIFYGLRKGIALKNLNEYEGEIALELWKYNPLILVDDLPTISNAVDPLSLYLSMKDRKDERIEMALDEMMEKIIW
ncbi:MAG TPA: hypothetical protein PKL52_03440 [Tenuifilaceae bacterium]|nr:hypothetical protein [Tenuifilaceae bacterium]